MLYTEQVNRKRHMINATATRPLFRTFTRDESSAIYNLHIEQEGYVEVIFQSNTEKAYGFSSTPAFCEVLSYVISTPDLAPYIEKQSIGKLIAQARRNGDLVAI